MKNIIFLLSFLFLATGVAAQKSALADQYFKKGEYEKAETLYAQIYKQGFNSYYLKKYVEVLVHQEKYDEAEKTITTHLNKKPQDTDVYILQGSVYEDQGKLDKAKKAYNEVVEKLPNNEISVKRAAYAFTQAYRKDMAIATYEKGRELLGDDTKFAYELARLYSPTEEPELTIKNYLITLEQDPKKLNTIKLLLQRDLPKENYPKVQEVIYNRISEGKDHPAYADLLSWVALQSEDYFTAFIQMRAIDQRLNENGEKVYNIAKIAQNAGDYDTAITGYEYIINEKGAESTYYLSAFLALINTRKAIALKKNPIVKEDFIAIDSSYDDFISNIGKNALSASAMLNQAEFNMRYLDNQDKAREILEDIVNIPSSNRYIRAQAKMKLADYYLIKGNRWESTLLYSQVDKEFPEEEIGEEARFRNAMLSYYMGDFVWAKQQYDILKAATSRIISNDAIDMSVFIADNLNLDTTAVPMEMYADAELLLFQNKYKVALSKLEDLKSLYPEHNLKDDIVYLKGKIYEKQESYDQAIQEYTYIMDNYPEEIRADNAIFRLAEIYEYKKQDIDSAMRMYEKLYLDYDSSTFSVIARKRFRILNGDNIQ